MADLILGLIFISGGLFFIILFYFYMHQKVISETQRGRNLTKKYVEHLRKFYFAVGIIYVVLGLMLLLSIITRNASIIIATIFSFVIIPITLLKIIKRYNA